ncbi:MAG: hypothetical protein RMJ05_07925 [Thermomicrobium sp.]|nr:hypothetical protein [Thermomicrobium sp.]MDW8006635.1 hypothetical protein [Thermomicrobium sp.]
MAKLKRPEPFVYEDLPELVAARERLRQIENELFSADATRSRLAEERTRLRTRVVELEVRELAGEDVAEELAAARVELEQAERALAEFPSRVDRLRQAKDHLQQEIARLTAENRRRKWAALAPHYVEAVRELADVLQRAKEANDRLVRLLAVIDWDVPPDWPREWREFISERGHGYVNPSKLERWLEQLEEFLAKWT